MSILIKTESFKDALQKLSKVVPTRSTLPLLSCVKIEYKNNMLLLNATNLETNMTIEIPCEGQEDSVIMALPTMRLLELTNNLNTESFSIHCSEQYKILFKTKNGNYKMMSQNPEEFPANPVITETKSINIKTETLKNLIDFTKNSPSKDELKPALQGVYTKLEGSMITAVSTDGHRLAKIVAKNPQAGEDTQQELIIPTKFLTLIYPFLEKQEELNIEFSNSHISVSLKGNTISSRLINDTYPEFEKVIPSNNPKTMFVNKQQIVESIKRVSVLSNRNTKQIAMAISNNNILIKSEDKENTTSGKEAIPCKYSSEDITIGYNAQFLTEAINNIDGDEIKICFNEPTTATTIFPTTKQEAETLMLVMPIRINENEN